MCYILNKYLDVIIKWYIVFHKIVWPVHRDFKAANHSHFFSQSVLSSFSPLSKIVLAKSIPIRTSYNFRIYS